MIDAHDIWVVEIKMPKELIGNFKFGKQDLDVDQNLSSDMGGDLNIQDAT